MKRALLLFSILAISSIVFCQCSPNRNDDIDRLKELQLQEQTAHLTKDVPLFLDIFADTLCQIKNGTVSYFTKEQISNRFTNYFSSVEFLKWEDSAAPLIQISDDGSMAHILVQKHVELYVLGDTTQTINITDFAWTELWKKDEGKWKLHTTTSTEK